MTAVMAALGESSYALQTDVNLAAFVAALTIFCYDYLLGISREVELMWQGRFHYATVLYFITRYFPIAYLTYNVAGVRADAHQSYCLMLLHMVDVLYNLALTTTTVVLVLQTYAMYNKNMIVLAVLSTLGIGTIILDCFEAAHDSCTLDSPNGSPTERQIFLLATLTAFSSIVVSLTMYKFFGIIRQKKRLEASLSNDSLMGIIFSECLCLIGVSGMRLFNILLYGLAPDTFNFVVNPFVLPITAVFISHFLLNLRAVNRAPMQTVTSSLLLTSVSIQNHTPIDAWGGETGDGIQEVNIYRRWGVRA